MCWGGGAHLFSGNLPSIYLSQTQDMPGRKDGPLGLWWQLFQQRFSLHLGSSQRDGSGGHGSMMCLPPSQPGSRYIHMGDGEEE